MIAKQVSVLLRGLSRYAIPRSFLDGLLLAVAVFINRLVCFTNSASAIKGPDGIERAGMVRH